jgi:hypothetical protein
MVIWAALIVVQTALGSNVLEDVRDVVSEAFVKLRVGLAVLRVVP